MDLGMLELALEWEHARVAGGLPLHHRDPFDRMLVAQAIVKWLTIVTRDDVIPRYPVPVIAA
jgi:PIN domain nuclease of toxin-antitoxin system